MKQPIVFFFFFAGLASKTWAAIPVVPLPQVVMEQRGFF